MHDTSGLSGREKWKTKWPGRNYDGERESGEIKRRKRRGGRERDRNREMEPRVIAERDRAGERGGLFKRASQLSRMNIQKHTETAENVVFLPQVTSRGNDQVKWSKSQRIFRSQPSYRRPCANYSRYECLWSRLPNYVKECNQNRDSPCKFLRNCRCIERIRRLASSNVATALRRIAGNVEI